MVRLNINLLKKIPTNKSLYFYYLPNFQSRKMEVNVMKKLITQIETMVERYFRGYKFIIDKKTVDNGPYKLKLSRKFDVTEVVIYPKFIKNIIHSNFTIFERIYYGKRLQNSAIMVILSTINNLICSKDFIEDIMDISKKQPKTEFEYERLRGEYELISKKFAENILPYADRNKYIAQLNITVSPKLGNIFSDVLLENFMDFIGYRR